MMKVLLFIVLAILITTNMGEGDVEGDETICEKAFTHPEYYEDLDDADKANKEKRGYCIKRGCGYTDNDSTCQKCSIFAGTGVDEEYCQARGCIYEDSEKCKGSNFGGNDFCNSVTNKNNMIMSKNDCNVKWVGCDASQPNNDEPAKNICMVEKCRLITKTHNDDDKKCFEEGCDLASNGCKDPVTGQKTCGNIDGMIEDGYKAVFGCTDEEINKVFKGSNTVCTGTGTGIKCDADDCCEAPQTCKNGFKKNGEGEDTDGKFECPKGKTVHATDSCKKAKCEDKKTDQDTCCSSASVMEICIMMMLLFIVY